MQDTAEDLLARVQHLKARRQNFDNQWQEVKDLIWTEGADFTQQRSPGEKTNTEVFDANPSLALEQGAAALETFLMPRTQRWHRLIPTEPSLRESAEVKAWFERASDVLFQFRSAPRARFHSQAHEAGKSLLAYGNQCMRVMELPTGGTAYRYVHVGATWIDVDPDGIVDTVFYEYPLTAKAAIQRWGEKAPECAKNAVKANPYTEHIYVHAVVPNGDYDDTKADPEHARFKAYEINCENRVILESGGYHELPYIWSRYTVNPAEVYGRGPAMLVLPDIKTLQAMERVFLRSGQKIADPPLLIPDDGVIGRGNRRVKAASGALIRGGVDAQGRPLILPLQTGGRLDITLEMANQRRELIRKAFGLDLFEILVQDRVEMTATEVLERQREKGQLLAPVIGRQQSEWLGPMIERELKIAQRQRKLPPLPQELIEARGDYEIEYESDATRMQKSAEVAAVARSMEAVAPFIQANPSMLDVWKVEDLIRHTYETLGGPTKLLNTKREFARIQEAQAQAQQQAQMAEQMPGVAKGMRDLAAVPREAAA